MCCDLHTTVSLDQELLIDEDAWEHGELQETSCRNGFFAVLFLMQAGLILTFACMGIVSLANQDSGDWDPNGNNGIHPTRAVVFLLAITGSVMVLSASMMMLLLGALAEMMIQVSLVISPLSCGLGSIFALVTGQIVGSIVLAVLCMFGICYAVHVWKRIPFAAANVATAMEAIKVNQGVLPLAYTMALLTMLWTLLWAFALGYVMVTHKDWVMECKTPTDDEYNDGSPECHLSTRGKWILAGLLLSFYWTCQVLKNVLHTTIAGVVGTWWFAPEDAATGGCCNATLRDSWHRSTVYSFGSICLGSLVVAILQVLQFLVQMARQQEDDQGRRRRQTSLLWCLLQCIVDQLEKLFEYVNKWALGTFRALEVLRLVSSSPSALHCLFTNPCVFRIHSLCGLVWLRLLDGRLQSLPTFSSPRLVRHSQ